ncbi:MAG: hypothetical protein JWP30_2060, partial [Homoserinimonas sp.]|nr:hypothetical protein [Homoserinimonas sp.]
MFWSALALLLLVLIAIAWVGIRGLIAKGDLEAAVPLASEIQDEVVAGDGDAAGETAQLLDSHASSAANLTSDPVWRAFETLPLLGPNLTAVRELAAVVGAVSRDAIVPLVHTAGVIEMGDFKPAGGAIDLRPLLEAQPQVEAAQHALASAQEQVDAIDTTRTLTQVQDAAARLASSISEAAASVTAVDRAVQLIPAMLGAEEPRNYVLLFANPAELRATGGNPGAVALVHTANGRIDLAQQASTSDFPHYTAPVLDLPVETRGLYGDITGQYMQNVNLTPQFPLSAQLAREMWRLEFGVEADGVISIDPVALGYLLEATGPITLPTGDLLASDNAVQLLLVDVYARYDDPADLDAFFAAAAASVFSAVASGNSEPAALITALATAGEERRVLIWSARDDEQTVLDGTSIT